MATYVRQQQVTHRIGPSGRLQVKLTESDVRIRPSEGDEVRLNATFEIAAGSDEEADRIFDEVKLIASARPSFLEVRSPSEDEPRNLRQALGLPDGATLRSWITGRPRAELSLDVEAPRGCELRVETVSGDLVVEGMAGDQRYTTVSGDQYLTELGGSVRIGTVSGDATLRAQAEIELRAETVSGDLSVIAPRLEELRVSTVSGDLEVEGELAPKGEHRIESVSGDLRFGLVGSATFDVRGISTDIHADMAHRIEGRLDRRRIIIGSGQPTVVFSSMSGDIAVRHPRRVERRSDETTPSSAEAAENAASSASIDVLRALERGEIDVDEATRRLAGGSTASSDEGSSDA
jgi:hypothetical protein